MKEFSFKINGNQYDVEIKSVNDNIAEVEVNGYIYSVETESTLETTKTPKIVIPENIPSTNITPSEQKTSSPSAPKGSGNIMSPLPGTILDIYVKVGDKVNIGDKVICLEAMKMENVINSDKAGTITAVNIKKGDVVMEGDLIIQID